MARAAGQLPCLFLIHGNIPTEIVNQIRIMRRRMASGDEAT
jgi:hypothetical protein